MSLLTEASLVITPNAVEEGKLFSIIPTDGSGDLTVTRATTATRVNSAGLIEEVPYNLLQRSEEFDNAYWTKLNTTATANTTTAPNGTITADTLVSSAGVNSFLYKILPFVSGTSYTLSFYVKANTAQTIRIYGGGGGIGTSSNLNVTTDWTRISYTFTPGSTGSFDVGIRCNSSNTNFDIFIWGAQLVKGSSAKEYFPTTDRLDVPRLDYTNSSCPSILVEPQRTNLLLRSEEFENASWTKTNSTVTANQAIAPDGALTADKYIPIDTGESSIRHNLTFVSSVYTPSIYVKLGDFASGGLRFFLAGTVGANATLNIQTGEVITSGATFVAGGSDFVGNGWYRVYATINNTFVGTSSIRFSLTDTSGNLVPGNGTDGIYIWGAQLEQGSYATSYIPTVASTVTRNADVISKTGIADLIGQTEGTIFVEMSALTNDLTFREITINNGSANRYVMIRFDNVSSRISVFINNGAVQGLFSFVVPEITNFNKVAYVYGSTFKLFVNGVKVGETTGSTFTGVTLNTLSFSRFNTLPFYGKVKNLLLWKTSLTDEELANLTTL